MSARKVGKKLAVTVIVATGLISMTLGIVPSVLAAGKTHFKFYDMAYVCIGLPLALTRPFNTTEFFKSTYISDFSLVAVGFSTEYKGLITDPGYGHVFFYHTVSWAQFWLLPWYHGMLYSNFNRNSKIINPIRPHGWNDRQIKLTTKVSVIVATDFWCWFPIILLGILVQLRGGGNLIGACFFFQSEWSLWKYLIWGLKFRCWLSVSSFCHMMCSIIHKSNEH